MAIHLGCSADPDELENQGQAVTRQCDCPLQELTQGDSSIVLHFEHEASDDGAAVDGGISKEISDNLRLSLEGMLNTKFNKIKTDEQTNYRVKNISSDIIEIYEPSRLFFCAKYFINCQDDSLTGSAFRKNINVLLTEFENNYYRHLEMTRPSRKHEEKDIEPPTVPPETDVPDADEANKTYLALYDVVQGKGHILFMLDYHYNNTAALKIYLMPAFHAPDIESYPNPIVYRLSSQRTNTILIDLNNIDWDYIALHPSKKYNF